MLSLIRVARANDKTLFAIFEKLSAELRADKFAINYLGGAGWNQANDDTPKYSISSFLIDRIELMFNEGGSRITFRRGIYDPDQISPGNAREIDHGRFIAFRRSSSSFDEILLSGNNVEFRTIESFDKLIARIRVTEDDNSDAGESLTAIVTGQLEQLRQLALEFSQRQLDAEDRLEKAYKKREDALQKRILAENARIAERSAEEEAKLSEERQKIEAWRIEINDREPQHERRRLRESLTHELREAVKNPLTRAVEWRANLLYVVVGLFFVSVSVWLTVGNNAGTVSGSAAFWITAIKSLLAGLGGAAFIWAGLASLKSTAKDNRAYEQKTQQYAFDMDRASWIVETILQMNIVEKSQIPTEWLHAVCRDLFSTGEDVAGEQKSLEAFAALFDATAKARIGTNGVEFEIDRKGAKKLAAE